MMANPMDKVTVRETGGTLIADNGTEIGRFKRPVLTAFAPCRPEEWTARFLMVTLRPTEIRVLSNGDSLPRKLVRRLQEIARTTP